MRHARQRNIPDAIAIALFEATGRQWHCTYSKREPEAGDGYHAYVFHEEAEGIRQSLNQRFYDSGIPGFSHDTISIRPINAMLSTLVIPFRVTEDTQFRLSILDRTSIRKIRDTGEFGARPHHTPLFTGRIATFWAR